MITLTSGWPVNAPWARPLLESMGNLAKRRGVLECDLEVKALASRSLTRLPADKSETGKPNNLPDSRHTKDRLPNQRNWSPCSPANSPLNLSLDNGHLNISAAKELPLQDV